MSSESEGDAVNPYVVGVLVLGPIGLAVTAMAYLFTGPYLTLVVGAAFFGAVTAMAAYAVRDHRDAGTGAVERPAN